MGLLNPRALPRINRVATVALRAVLAEMTVVLVMTARAHLRLLYRARWLAMAFGALQFSVRAQQREVSLLRMIESPQRPTIARVTAFAFLTETSFVNVIVRMAIDASHGCPAECQCRVALRTARDPMQSK